MILLVDIGNTRVKWARLNGAAPGPQSAAVHAGWSVDDFIDTVLNTGGRPRRVLIGNVAGGQIADVARAAVVRACGIEPEIIRTAAAAAGVRNAYADPTKLGVDRWLALIAARALEPGAACVVDVGTAMTIDGLDARGQHLGGVIVPGPELMVSSLLRNTSDLAAFSREGSTSAALFADNTLGAIRQGVVHALAALIARAAETMRQTLGVGPALLLTGGDADRLQAAIGVPYRSVPDLVLHGLAVLARVSPGDGPGGERADASAPPTDDSHADRGRRSGR